MAAVLWRVTLVSPPPGRGALMVVVERERIPVATQQPSLAENADDLRELTADGEGVEELGLWVRPIGGSRKRTARA
jgi:hypothetical protein